MRWSRGDGHGVDGATDIRLRAKCVARRHRIASTAAEGAGAARPVPRTTLTIVSNPDGRIAERSRAEIGATISIRGRFLDAVAPAPTQGSDVYAGTSSTRMLLRRRPPAGYAHPSCSWASRASIKSGG